MPCSKSFWSTKLRNWSSVPATSILCSGTSSRTPPGWKRYFIAQLDFWGRVCSIPLRFHHFSRIMDLRSPRGERLVCLIKIKVPLLR
ncbi:hypothetical protein BDZ45DRAFT_355659 [Acephala macrosclerotiorum]|nr:hypothetical protein BDZ45DRAFT_355659 [Acephala macrosclerotiorum]